MTENSKRLLLASLLIAGITVFSACQAETNLPTDDSPVALTPPVVASPTQAPTATFQPAVEFTDGLAELPPEKYLFVEFWSDQHGKGGCDGLMIDFPTYSFNNGRLDGPVIDVVADKPLVGFFGEGRSLSGTAGGGASSGLSPIASLPYPIRDGQFTIHSVDSRGFIIATINNETVYMRPGQSWMQKIHHAGENDCEITSSLTFKNYGLVDVSVGEIQSRTTGECPGIDSQRNRLAWAADGSWLYAGETGLRMYDSSLQNELKLWPSETSVTSVSVSPDGKTIAFATSDGALQWVDLTDEGAEVQSLTTPPGPWFSLTFNPIGNELVSGAADGRIVFWNLETGSNDVTQASSGAERCVRNLIFSTNGTRFLVDAGVPNTEVWSFNEGKLAGINIGGRAETTSPKTISPDGLQVAAVKSGQIILLEATSASKKTSWSGAYQTIHSIQFSPDGSQLATGSDYGWIQLWDAESGSIIGAWQVGGGNRGETVVAVAISPDGSKLAALIHMGEQGDSLWVLDLASGESVQRKP